MPAVDPNGATCKPARPCVPGALGEDCSMGTVAILGASANRSKFGNKAVRAFLQQGYTVFPVNPKENLIEGLKVYPNLAALPSRPEMVSVYLPPTTLLKLLPEIA